MGFVRGEAQAGDGLGRARERDIVIHDEYGSRRYVYPQAQPLMEMRCEQRERERGSPKVGR